MYNYDCLTNFLEQRRIAFVDNLKKDYIIQNTFSYLG